jgi:hypothetical protein
LPDSQAGYYCSFELRTFFAANNKQGNSSDQRQTTEHWRNRNVLMVFPSGVDRSNIENLFLVGISESLIGKRQAAQNNQKNPSQDDWFHIDCPAAKPNASVPETNQ